MSTFNISIAVNVDTPVGINPARATSEFIYSLSRASFSRAFSRASISSRAITYVFQQPLKRRLLLRLFSQLLSFPLSYEEINIYPRYSEAAHFRLNVN